MIFLMLASLGCSYKVAAIEVMNNQPAVRAKGMAGLFVAIANDSSAIWYNPAGLASGDGAGFDANLSFAQQHVSNDISGRVSAGESYSQSERTTLDYAALSVKDFPLFASGSRFNGGIAYHRPAKLTFDVAATVNPVSALTFGLVQAQYHQLMLAYADHINSNWLYGVSLDGMWLDISCREFSICVNNGPYGLGLGVGSLYQQTLNRSSRLVYGFNWHSKIALGYMNGPESGMGSVVEQYVADRPESANLAIAFKQALRDAFVSVSLQQGYVRWSDTVELHKNLSDYHYYGVSVEWLQRMADSTLALRAGVKQSLARSTSIQSDFDTYAMGIGVSLFENLYVDLAYETKVVRLSGERIRQSSASYSYQF